MKLLNMEIPEKFWRVMSAVPSPAVSGIAPEIDRTQTEHSIAAATQHQATANSINKSDDCEGATDNVEIC